MSAQELLDLVADMKPSKNMERKPKMQPMAAPAGARQNKGSEAPMCAPIPPKRVELPALGGCVEIIYDWEVE